MPVRAVKRGKGYRVADRKGKTIKGKSTTKAKAQRQARAINASLSKRGKI